VTPGLGQFRPQGHNLNNFGRGPLDDATYQIWKLCALWFQTRRFLKIAFWKPIFWPCYLLMQPTETVWTTLIVKMFTHDARRTTHDDGRRTKAGHNSSPWARRRASSVVRKLFYLNIFSSETTHWIFTKLHRNDPWVVPYQSCSNRFSW